MQPARVLGVANPMQFPDDMDIDDIREFLRKRFANLAASGEGNVNLDPRQATAQAYSPTMQEKFSQGIGNALTSTGLVDDNYQAQNIGKNISNIAAFSPAGAAFGGDEFGTAAAKNDKLGMALGALEGVGIGGDIAKLAIFGGIMAKSADLGALAKAKKLETGGANRDEIWKETGWANDKGDWKFEIDDSESIAKPPSDWGWASQVDSEAGSSVTGNVGEFIGHNNLEGAYDGVMDFGDADQRLMMRVRPSIDGGGSFGDGSIDVGSALNNGGIKTADKSTALHELQHAIQQREGFASGGSPSNELALAMQKAGADEIRDTMNKMDLGELPYDYDIYSKLMREKTRILTETPDPSAAYQRLAGEAEARNVEKRMDWTPEQRRATPPWASLDVPEDELIYRKSGGINQSSVLGGLPMDSTSRTNRSLEQEYIDDAFHGTTHDFDEFVGDTLNKGGHFGGGHYFTSNASDAGDNYTASGPDLTNRIEQEKGRIEQELDDYDIDDIEELADKYGLAFDPDEAYPEELPDLMASAKLKGDNEGNILPVKLKTGNVFDIRQGKNTKLDYEMDVPDWEDYLDEADGDEDVARELADEASYDNEPTGQLVDFMESIRNQADEYGFDADELISEIQQEALGGDGLDGSRLDKIMRQTEWYAEDMETGELINTEVYRQALEDSGFDSIKHSANYDFPNMDMEDGTEHTIIFNPANIRSKFAKFDPKNAGKAGLLGAGAGAAVLTGTGEDDKRKPD